MRTSEFAVNALTWASILAHIPMLMALRLSGLFNVNVATGPSISTSTRMFANSPVWSCDMVLPTYLAHRPIRPNEIHLVDLVSGPLGSDSNLNQFSNFFVCSAIA